MTELAARPENVPEKFWDATTGAVNTTALLASYGELERKQSTVVTAPPAGIVPAAPRGDGLSISAPVAPVAGTVLEAAYTKSLKDGLTEADYTAFAKAGLSKANVDSHIEGRNAVFEGVKTKVYAIAGTPADYASMTSWAQTNLPKGEIDAFNDAMVTRNVHTMGLAVAGLKAKYTAAFGKDGKLIEATGGAVTSGVTPYANKQEWYKDTGSVQYRTDQTFRDTVNKRHRASKF